MRFQVKTEQELREEREAKRQLLDIKQVYDFDVFNVAEDVSKNSGKDMLVLTINLHTERGVKQFKDYIVPETQQDKLFEFCAATGQLKAYHTGDVQPEDFADASGKCKVAIEKGSPNGSGGFYPDKNKISRYLPPSSASAGTHPAMAGVGKSPSIPKEDDDDIPF